MIVNNIKNLNDNKDFFLPDFITAGCPRCGTTSLYQYMAYHPKVLLSSPKETRFFVFRGLNENELNFESKVVLKASVLDLKSYSKIFKKGENKVCGDFTVTSLKYHERFIKNINELYFGEKKPKIIIALRNPIEAVFSYYNYLYMSREIIDPDIMTFLRNCKNDYDAKSDRCQSVSSFFNTYDYKTQLTAILSEFEEVYIYLLDDLKENPKKVLLDIYDFLGLDFIMPKDLGEIYNMSGLGKRSWLVSSAADVLKNKVAKIIPEAMGRRIFSQLRHSGIEKAKMNDDVKNFLKENFKENIIETGKLIGRDLSDWLKI